MGRKVTYPDIQNMSALDKSKYYTAAYRRKNPERMLWRAAKSRAEKRGVVFNITIEDINIPDICPILNIPLFSNPQAYGMKGGKDNSPSLDRMDNSRGYETDNIQVISHKANSMKFTANREELLMFANWIKNTYE